MLSYKLMNVEWRQRIECKPGVLCGKPVVRGTRLSVEFLLGLLAGAWEFSQILEAYPGLTREDLLACLDYARELVATERIVPVSR